MKITVSEQCCSYEEKYSEKVGSGPGSSQKVTEKKKICRFTAEDVGTSTRESERGQRSRDRNRVSYERMQREGKALMKEE